MITFKLLRQGERLTGFQCSGHAGYGKAGSDIVCSAVSALTITCINAIAELLGITPEVKQDQETGYISLVLPEGMTPDQREGAQLLLKALALGMQGIQEEYSKHVQVVK